MTEPLPPETEPTAEPPDEAASRPLPDTLPDPEYRNGYGPPRECAACGLTKTANLFLKKFPNLCQACVRRKTPVPPRPVNPTALQATVALDGPWRAVPVRELPEELHLLDATRQKALRVLHEVIGQAAPKELIKAYETLTEKKLLWDQKPTQIISYQRREDKRQRFETAVAEARRRGLLVDVTPTEAAPA